MHMAFHPNSLAEALGEELWLLLKQDFYRDIWGFPKIRDSFLGVPIKRIIVLWGLYWGPPFRETII